MSLPPDSAAHHVPLHRNGYVKIALSFVIMGLALLMPNFRLGALQFAMGILYFLFGLNRVLDDRTPR